MSVEDVQQMSCSELLAQYESVLREIATLSGNGDPNTLNIVDVNAALRSGDYSDVEVQAAFEFNRRDCKLPNRGGGGGGGGGGSDPTPDPQPDPEPDRSQLSTRLESLSSPGPQEIQVFWSVTNEVTSGTGQQKSGTVAIDLDGRTQETQSVAVSPGGSQSGSVRLADVTPGTREVCVRLQ